MANASSGKATMQINLRLTSDEEDFLRRKDNMSGYLAELLREGMMRDGGTPKTSK